MRRTKQIAFERLSSFWKSLRRFKGLHRGETCYIFGDGPSLKWFDLSRFRDQPAICCGMLPFHNQFSDLDVRYCLLIEPWAFTPNFIRTTIAPHADSIGIIDAYRSAMDQNRDRIFFVHATNRPWLVGKNIYYVFRTLPGASGSTGALLSRYNLFAGSFHASLSLAWYFGFSRVYLAGFDGWTIDPPKAGHWYELGVGTPFDATNYAHEFLNVLQRDVEINVITVGGSSKNLNAVDYEQYTRSVPVFRENYELAPAHYLRALATYANYRIF